MLLLKCGSLSQKYPDQVLLNNETVYTTARQELWSTIQGAVSPACFFRPGNSAEVSGAVIAARDAKCLFAVKSGGHSAYAASTIQGGLVIDLVNMDAVSFSEDKKSATIEPGNTWDKVYPVLQEHGLIVPGGRMFGVGVGGLTLGGGVSWLSNLLGWTCDNVLEYELVLADGQIVSVTATSHPDLYWALRGGGSNYGIVTKLKFNAYAQDKIWFGRVRFNDTTNATFNHAYADWGSLQAPTDLRSGGVLVWNAFANSKPVGVALLIHANTYENDTHPKVFDKFYNEDATRFEAANTYHGDLAKTLVIPAGATRNSMWTTSFTLDTELLQRAYEIWEEETRSIASFAAVQQLQVQVITVSQMELMKRAGGNPSGLVGQKKAIGFLNLLTQWNDAADDRAAYLAQQRMESRIDAAAKERGLYNEYKYTNYASQFQDPFSGYGKANKKRLLDIAKKYDPEGVFQILEPYGFKITKGSPQTL
ncbi:FAD binding domain-containing protein [Colletotrichum truncatum]|uniref:FAD binding domain-containing protein n=1 Tax=Colletotrichum truncatum TaxID=5467 RepID=A0ACC3YMW1_COLTU